VSLTDRFWTWAANRRDRLVTNALEQQDDTDHEYRRLLERIDDEAA
jgi:hypothetical protein